MINIKDKKILLVDDEQQILDLIYTILKKDGFNNIFFASTFENALKAVEEVKPDIAVLDIILPDGDGLTLFNEIKKILDIPVIFLTAKGESYDKLLGLGLGADDYIVKPFLPRELTLRIGAILRRVYSKYNENDLPVLTFSTCKIDFGKAQVIKENEIYNLTAKEFAILDLLYKNANNIVSTNSLCEYAWKENSFGYENTLMVHIRHIREKIESNPSSPQYLKTVKGFGYKLVV